MKANNNSIASNNHSTSITTTNTSSSCSNNNDGSNPIIKSQNKNNKNSTNNARIIEASKREWYNIGLSEDDIIIRDTVVPSLMTRSYHLPGYTYQQDLYQYITNNHPIFGICFHHKYHPVGIYVRIVSLIGSLLFGLLITNIVYIGFYYANPYYNETYLNISNVAILEYNNGNNNSLASYENTATQALQQSMSITNANIVLWTVGALIHGIYDEMLWHLSACTCYMSKDYNITEQQQRYKSTGSIILTIVVVCVFALSTLIFLLVTMINNDVNDIDGMLPPIGDVNFYKVPDSNNTNTTTFIAEMNNTTNIQFLLSYSIELLLTYFIYDPIVSIISFTGILSCYGRYKICGGRPYEIKQEELEELEKKDKEHNKNKNSIDRMSHSNNNNIGVDMNDEVDEEEVITPQEKDDTVYEQNIQ